MSEELKPARPLWVRLWPFYVIGAGIIAAWQQGVFDYLSLEQLREQQDVVKGIVADN